ncbi:hypothetical protein D3C86_1899660 [compost metagenome]
MITACMASVWSVSMLGISTEIERMTKSKNPPGVKISIQTMATAMPGVKVGRKKTTRNHRCPILRLEIQTASPNEMTMFSTRYSAVKNSVLRSTGQNCGSAVKRRT